MHYTLQSLLYTKTRQSFWFEELAVVIPSIVGPYVTLCPWVGEG